MSDVILSPQPERKYLQVHSAHSLCLKGMVYCTDSAVDKLTAHVLALSVYLDKDGFLGVGSEFLSIPLGVVEDLQRMVFASVYETPTSSVPTSSTSASSAAPAFSTSISWQPSTLLP